MSEIQTCVAEVEHFMDKPVQSDGSEKRSVVALSEEFLSYVGGGGPAVTTFL